MLFYSASNIISGAGNLFSNSSQFILGSGGTLVQQEVIAISGGAVGQIVGGALIASITGNGGNSSETWSENKDENKRMTTKEATSRAEKLGFKKTNYNSHGQPVYKKGNRYITPDVDSHNGGMWKMADSVENLRSKSTRLGTYDENLIRIGD